MLRRVELETVDKECYIHAVYKRKQTNGDSIIANNSNLPMDSYLPIQTLHVDDGRDQLFCVC